MRKRIPQPFECPVCHGIGKVYRETDAYRATAATAGGGSFGWTGPTHELVVCNACGGKGVLWR